jgi:exopolysaccharide biosynthesis polyprenyl glycosylphosphotransferase
MVAFSGVEVTNVGGATQLDRLVVRAPAAARGPRVRRPLLTLGARLRLIDTAALLFAWATAELIFPSAHGFDLLVTLAGSIAVSIFFMMRFGLYDSTAVSTRSIEISRIARVCTGALVLAALIHLSLLENEPWELLAAAGAIMFFALVIGRSVFDSWLRDQRLQGRHCRSEIIVGDGDAAAELCEILGDHPELGHRVLGYIGDPTDTAMRGAEIPWLGWYDDVERALRISGATGAVVIVGSKMGPVAERRVIEKLRASNVRVRLSLGVLGIASRYFQAAPIAHEALFSLAHWAPSRSQRVCKRAIDLVAGAVLLILTMPVMFVCALAIKLTSPGPILFRQTRIGLQGVPFTVLKLRTMRVDAEQARAELENENLRDGPLFKMRDDPRVTRVGRLLRITSLDELPQLFNVLRGQMSLVGPRPALPEEVAQFDDELLDRLQVKPGITGLWQVDGRDNPAFRLYRRLDRFYALNWSVALDLVILVLTAQQVGARMLRMMSSSSDHGVLE